MGEVPNDTLRAAPRAGCLTVTLLAGGGGCLAPLLFVFALIAAGGTSIPEELSLADYANLAGGALSLVSVVLAMLLVGTGLYVAAYKTVATLVRELRNRDAD